jgi:hypothetical protein
MKIEDGRGSHHQVPEAGNRQPASCRRLTRPDTAANRHTQAWNFGGRAPDAATGASLKHRAGEGRSATRGRGVKLPRWVEELVSTCFVGHRPEAARS